MRLVNSLRRRITNFFFTRLIQGVRNKEIRPFSVDEQGLWFKTKYGFSVYSNLEDRILELDTNATWEKMIKQFNYYFRTELSRKQRKKIR